MNVKCTPHGTTCWNSWLAADSVVYGHRGPFGILGTLKVILVSGSVLHSLFPDLQSLPQGSRL